MFCLFPKRVVDIHNEPADIVGNLPNPGINRHSCQFGGIDELNLNPGRRGLLETEDTPGTADGLAGNCTRRVITK